MTTTKKLFIRNIIFITVFILTIVLVIIFNYNKSQSIKFLNYPTNYSLCNNNVFDIKIYASKDDVSFFNQENIIDSWIEDYEGNIYKVEINDIWMENKVLVNNQNYYPYYLQAQIPFSTEGIENIPICKLYIVNNRGEKIHFNIGNISIANGDFYSLVEVKSIKGSTKQVDNYITLDKINLELYNFQNAEVVLKKIELVSNVVTTLYNEEIIDEKTTKKIIVPLTYIDNSYIDNIGIIITIEYAGSLYQQVIYPRVLFKSSLSYNKGYENVYEVH
ncbi:MAG: hypothetical protein IJX78_02240 [Bacilli bacterium]|nr:hypothetical protein [Bacilli bacterium]